MGPQYPGGQLLCLQINGSLHSDPQEPVVSGAGCLSSQAFSTLCYVAVGMWQAPAEVPLPAVALLSEYSGQIGPRQGSRVYVHAAVCPVPRSG